MARGGVKRDKSNSKTRKENELEAKTPEPQPEKHPEKSSLKAKVSKDNQIFEPTNLGSQKSVEKERPNLKIKSIFPKNELYMEATHLLPLSNLKLPRLQISDPLTRELSHQPIASTYLPFKQNQSNFIFENYFATIFLAFKMCIVMMKKREKRKKKTCKKTKFKRRRKEEN